MTEKGKIFKGYASDIVYKYGFGSNKMVTISPDMFTTANIFEAEKLRDELISEGYLREYSTVHTSSHGSKGFKRYSTMGYHWIGLTEKGWAVANRYLEAK